MASIGLHGGGGGDDASDDERHICGKGITWADMSARDPADKVWRKRFLRRLNLELVKTGRVYFKLSQPGATMLDSRV